MRKTIRIGTRESQLALWQATEVKKLLENSGHHVELVLIKSEGDIDLKTPLYAMGVQGVFTRSLDIALLNNHIDIAVHSMKDVPVQLPEGITQAAVLPRGPVQDLLVYSNGTDFLQTTETPAVIATSSIRRKAQWLGRYPAHAIVNLRGNVNTRLRKLSESSWHGAIFALAGLDRIGLRPQNSMVLDWMLPAPAQGAIMVVCRSYDQFCVDACLPINDPDTANCTRNEREFLHMLMGGCSTPISALATIKDGTLYFKGNVCSPTGDRQLNITLSDPLSRADDTGKRAAAEMLKQGASEIIAAMNNGNTSQKGA